jgi:hypothetical protein
VAKRKRFSHLLPFIRHKFLNRGFIGDIVGYQIENKKENTPLESQNLPILVIHPQPANKF